jgi:uncharacterized protein
MATIAAPTNLAAPAPEVAADKPLPNTNRILALDFVRGAALFGILLMNITGMGLPEAYGNPTNAGGAEGANLWAWIITQVGFEGTQRGLFSILFGAGVILFTSRLEAAGRADSADIYFRRNLWLIAFGCVNSFLLLWTGDILYYYGITALFLYAFRTMSAKSLLVFGIVVMVLATAWNAKDTFTDMSAHSAWQSAVQAKAAGAKLTKEQEGAIKAWEGRMEKFSPGADAIRQQTEAVGGGYASAFLVKAEENVRYQSWMLYRYFGDIFGMMIIGMALFKYGVLTLDRPKRLYVAMMLIGYGIGLAVNIAETRWIIDHKFSFVSFAQAGATYDVGRLAMTIGHLGALLLFVRSGALPWFRHALASVGQMAFTNYLAHSVVALVLFVFLGFYGQLERHQLYYIVFAVWAVQLVASPIWLKHYRFGPLEWLWRYLTYGKRPPFRREVPAPAAAVPVAAE